MIWFAHWTLSDEIHSDIANTSRRPLTMSVATPIERRICGTERKTRQFKEISREKNNPSRSNPLNPLLPPPPRPPIIFRDVTKAHTGKTRINSKNNNNAQCACTLNVINGTTHARTHGTIAQRTSGSDMNKIIRTNACYIATSA